MSHEAYISENPIHIALLVLVMQARANIVSGLLLDTKACEDFISAKQVVAHQGLDLLPKLIGFSQPHRY